MLPITSNLHQKTFDPEGPMQRARSLQKGMVPPVGTNEKSRSR